jgi:PAS domain S-box-containing protein
MSTYEKEYARQFFEYSLFPLSYLKTIRDDEEKVRDFTFIDVNPSFEKLLGLPRSEIILRKASDVLFPFIDNTVDWANLLSSSGNNHDQIDSFLIIKQSRVRYQIHIHPCLDNRKQSDLFFLSLCTCPGFRKIEETLLESEQRWKHALEGSGLGVWDWNAETGEVFYSKRWKSMLGYRDEEIGNTYDEWESRIHPDDFESTHKAIEEEFSGKLQMSRHEHRLQCKDGSYKWILSLGKVTKWSFDGKPLRAIGTHIDISERKKSEEALSRREHELRVILETTRDGYWLVDMERNITDTNEAYQEMSGYSKKELLTMKIDDVDTFEPKEKKQERIYRIKERGYDLFEARHRKKDGTTMDIEISASFLNVSPPRIICFCRDITERKKMEEQLIQAKQLAEAANIAKTRFLSNMSHELRNPLNGIFGFSELLWDTPLTDAQKECVNYITTSSKVLKEIVGNILDFSKIEAGKMELQPTTVDLYELCLQVKQMVSFQAKEKNIETNLDYDPSIPGALYIDPLRLQQVLLNLVGNAIKFTNEGSVTIRVSRIDNLKSSQRTVLRFEVQDTGIGIKREDCKKIFIEFEQGDPSTTRKYGGTGLGLTIAKEILTLMGSELRVYSQPNVGSTFYFKLLVNRIQKLSHKVHQKQVQVVDEPLSRLQRSVKALLVEDEPINMLLTKKLLLKIHSDVEIIEASNGEEALQKYLKYRPDITFMDVQMPIMDGYSATVRIRTFEEREGGHCPIIALTAAADKNSVNDCRASGMDDVLTKPLSFSELEKVFKKWIRNRPVVKP